MTWTISKRITANSSLLIALLLAVGSVAYYNLRVISREAASIRDDNVAGLVYSGLISSSLKDSFLRTTLAGQATTADEREKLIKEQEAISPVTSDALSKYETSIFDPEDREFFSKVTANRSVFGEARAHYYAALRKGDAAGAKALLEGELLPAYNAFTKSGDDLQVYNNKQSTAQADRIVEKTRVVNTAILVVSIISIVLGALAATLIIRSINKVLQEVSGILGSSADQTASAAHQVSSSSQTLAEGASEQAASLE